jgi:tRNA G18 (ribose-2'-O)-methylase SpoU
MADDFGPYLNLRERDLRREGLFIGEGRMVVERLLSSGWPLESVLVEEKLAAHFRPLTAERCPLLVVSAEQMAKIPGFNFHRGVLAAGRRVAALGLERFLEQHPDASRLVFLCGIADVENLGALLRAAAAFGVEAVAMDHTCCDPWNRRTLKVSMAAALAVPVLELPEPRIARAACGRPCLELVAATPCPDAEALARYAPPQRWALLFGSEAAGLPPEWIAAADQEVRIPMSAGVDSLNVAMAAGIMLYKFCAAE